MSVQLLLDSTLQVPLNLTTVNATQVNTGDVAANTLTLNPLNTMLQQELSNSLMVYSKGNLSGVWNITGQLPSIAAKVHYNRVGNMIALNFAQCMQLTIAIGATSSGVNYSVPLPPSIMPPSIPLTGLQLMFSQLRNPSLSQSTSIVAAYLNIYPSGLMALEVAPNSLGNNLLQQTWDFPNTTVTYHLE